MRVVTSVFLPVLLTVLLGGCGGGSHQSGSRQGRTGKATFTIKWPERAKSASRSRLIPEASNSIKVQISNANVVVTTQVLPRPTGGGSSTVTFDPLPVGDLTVAATAYPQADGTGTAQATAAAPLIIQASQNTPFSLTMGTTIDHIEVSPAAISMEIGMTQSLTAAARDATGAVVLLAPSQSAWSTDNSAIAAVSASGTVTGVSVGPATITFTDQESGKKGSASVSVKASDFLQISTSPSLVPAFDPNISDYVLPDSNSAPVQVQVAAPANTLVSVDGQPLRGSTNFTTPVNVSAGQSFAIIVNVGGSSRTYYVRRLPADFPTWNMERPGTPQAAYYLLAPNISTTSAPSTWGRYAILVDNYGVPLWWYRSANPLVDAKLLPNGHIAWTAPPVAEERALAGSLVHSFAPTQAGETLDNHELQLLPNGNYVFIANMTRGPVDLSAQGGSASAMVVDNVIEEVTPAGTLVWRWSSLDHLPLAETDPHWWPNYIINISPADPYHMNAVEADGDGYVVSLRHLNALVRIDKASGNIVWKLGGTPRAESLTFVGDPYGNFGGQHDARILADGTLTLHDNGGQLNRAPRAVRYRLDPNAKTATLLEQVTDGDVPVSGCCGGARKLPEGNWVMSWGANPFVTELTSAGQRVFRLTLTGSFFSYRANPIPPGGITRDALRQGMDAQYPR